ncbi:(p)ppGpp synthase/HD superfamily hydrolase [Natronocella acetinitrilica]|uniref:(P)ppGpp synthase/HD superfamily hydrolase n=1 Tax=Natronocella acetinitrilica TaxID=414046 RepID=A0AAE3G229_9GAMM|nr:HD domain-containing protein [Natronocella acetinitrilica]MCP1674326.1 (p)ppGpp synthase/HD superfamily hydrolase [Natronocella acetinitrilica]
MTTRTPPTLSAMQFAVAAHGAQVRKYTGEPYWKHLAEVAGIVAAAGGSEAMVAAAWLHDVVEDTEVGIDQIEAHFGGEVAELVGWLTDVSRPADGNRAARKALDRAHIARAPADAQTVKLADLISNTSSIATHDPDFARVYLKEKAALLAVMDRADPALMAITRAHLAHAEALARRPGEVEAGFAP